MTKYQHLTHAYVHWLADMHSGSFAPAFTLSQCDSECSRKPPNAHSLGRWQQAEKKEKRVKKGADHPVGYVKAKTDKNIAT